MNVVLEFKTALENVASRTDIDSGVAVPRTYTFDEIVAIEKGIIEANKNRTSDYNPDNFENDSNELLEKHINFLKDFDNQKKNRSLAKYIHNDIDHLFMDKKFHVRLYTIPESDYYVLPYVKSMAHNLPHYNIERFDDSMVGVRIVLIENSFSDLLLKSFGGFYSDNVKIQSSFHNGKICKYNNPVIEITRHYAS